MARLDPEIEVAAMEALDKLILKFGVLSPSPRALRSSLAAPS